MAVNHKNIVAHSSVERNFGDDVHSGVAELKRDHCKIGFGALKEAAKATSFRHF